MDVNVVVFMIMNLALIVSPAFLFMIYFMLIIIKMKFYYNYHTNLTFISIIHENKFMVRITKPDRHVYLTIITYICTPNIVDILLIVYLQVNNSTSKLFHF